MIPAADITMETQDITGLYRALTGDRVYRATAHLRGGTITAVRVQHPSPLTMCRNGAIFTLSQATVDAIEAGDQLRALPARGRA